MTTKPLAPGGEMPAPGPVPPDQDGRREVVFLAAAGVIGTFLVASGWMIQGESYVPGLLLQIGSSFVLVVPLLLLGRLMERRLRRTEERTLSISRSLTDVRARLDETAMRIAELGTQTRQRMAQQRAEDLQAATTAEERLSQPILVSLLDRATRVQAVAAKGVRVRVPGTAYWLRFLLSPGESGDTTLTCSVENRAATQAAMFIWAEDEGPDALAHRVADELLVLRAYPGDQVFDASTLYRDLLHTIRTGLERRADASADRLGPLIELANDQWAIAADGLYCLDRPYHIPGDRLADASEDWRRHMAAKPWVDQGKFSEAYTTAVALSGSARAER
jgi:hypothetical protein